MDSPTPRSNYARRRKSAPAVTEELSDASPSKNSKDKAKDERKEKPGYSLGLDLAGLKDKLGEGLEDLTVKLHATVCAVSSPTNIILKVALSALVGRWTV
jgi:hypothetical protein